MRHLSNMKLLPLVLALGASPASHAFDADHREFDAALHAPYKAAKAAQEGRRFTLRFSYPFVDTAHDVAWRLELVDPAGRVIESWQGSERLAGKPIATRVDWAGRAGDPALRDGIYQVRMAAVAHEAGGRGKRPLTGDEIEALLGAEDGHRIEQSWDIAVGETGPVPMPAFQALPTAKGDGKQAAAATSGVVSPMAAPATGSLPYTVYYANLHSQSNHSDGGTAVAACSGSETPQGGTLGPADAFAYAKGRGLDILMTSEHNHMYDGSSSTNASASPSTAKAMYQSGLKAASDFNLANPGFLGVYGLEWGVISNGGHLNILNSSALLGWEYNGSGQLLADVFTPKSDYAALYTTMKTRGLIGQFNHPDSSGQFLVGGVPLGYTADGDEAMVLCEVLNTSAFSTNTTETETGRSNFESGCKKALEAGFHVAFSSNQDNHCANWGASYTNRTGVLIPTGTALSQSSFIEALRARRVFATMDKTSQLVLTANGRLMGERITNSGPLNLVANFASSSGKTVSSVAIFEGVPKRNGTVTQLSTSANTTITPSVGEHFYYARITQSDGKILWSAPIWVTQTSGGSSASQLLANPGFESGAASWSATSGVINNSTATPARSGSYKARFNGYGTARTDTLMQAVAIPASATSATLSFWLQVQSAETTTTTAYDTLKAQVRNGSGTVLATLATYSNLNKGASYAQKSFDLSAYKGQTVQVFFTGTEGSTLQTTFLVDNVALTVQ